MTGRVDDGHVIGHGLLIYMVRLFDGQPDILFQPDVAPLLQTGISVFRITVKQGGMDS